MATVRTIESGTNFLNFPVSGVNYSLTFHSIEWTNGGNEQWIYIPNDPAGTGHVGVEFNPTETVFIDTNDSTAVANIVITGLSFVRSASYWSNLQTGGNLGAFLTDLLGGNDTIFGNNSLETLVGFAGNDILIGDGGPDQLFGSTGNNTAGYQTSPTAVRASLAAPGTNTSDAAGDQYFSIQNLIGSKFGDTLEGDAGANRLTGALGADTLRGNGAADIFDFNSVKETKKGGARDKIVDFSHGQHDRIDLKDIDAKSGSGNQKFTWIGKSKFHDEKGELRYIDKGATVIVQGDTNGDGKADFEIFVAEPSLSRSDFIL